MFLFLSVSSCSLLSSSPSLYRPLFGILSIPLLVSFCPFALCISLSSHRFLLLPLHPFPHFLTPFSSFYHSLLTISSLILLLSRLLLPSSLSFSLPLFSNPLPFLSFSSNYLIHYISTPLSYSLIPYSSPLSSPAIVSIPFLTSLFTPLPFLSLCSDFLIYSISPIPTFPYFIVHRLPPSLSTS